VNRKEPQTPIRRERRIKQNTAVKECEGKGEQNECVAVCDIQIDGWLSTMTLIWWLAMEGLDLSFACMYCVSSITTYILIITPPPHIAAQVTTKDAKKGCSHRRGDDDREGEGWPLQGPVRGIGQSLFRLRPRDWPTTTLKQ
jgi:hypothetical protein